MAFQIIPLSTQPNQTMTVTLTVDGAQLTLGLAFKYSQMCGYWLMTIFDANNNLLVDSIPMITGSFPGGNLLRGQGYLQIGSAYLINQSNGETDYPDNTNLGITFLLLWGDTCE
jgi:uncharacterized membrane protein YedE/YeeE